MQRLDTKNEFPVEAGSSLAGDDSASQPYQVSHAVRCCIHAGVDHLHALKRQVVDAGVVHTMAPFSLARGALENLSIAYWILHPKERDERITRALRWHAQNVKDNERANGPQGRGLPNCEAEPYLLKIEAVGRKRPGVPVAAIPKQPGMAAVKAIRDGHTSSEAVKYSQDNAVTAGSVLWAWQLCSGFAHGRQWAILGVSDRETHPTSDPDVMHLRLSANLGAVQLVALEALHLLTDVLRTYDQRAGSHLEQIVK
ncbi:Uncharacterised protein [Nocardia otitidiscaviarum]|uniref:Uncharacterized protein n=2 Tax=Nocardia otitidiscaviarum TaxID=1823 RepID=A0A378YG73_9NOCA|nr:Uncharacterised protein [Nocardia otitidiscaviarum]